MAIYGIGIQPQKRFGKRSANQFLINGMNAEEWVEANPGKSFTDFWELEREVLQGNASAIFDQAASLAESSILSFPLDGLLSTSNTVATRDIQQVLSAHSNWSYLSQIQSQGDALGNVFGLDLETFGNISKGEGVYGITEVALGRRSYAGKGATGVMTDNLSIAIGINQEQRNYLSAIINKVEASGWNSLDKDERVAFLRTTMYGGESADATQFDIFRKVHGSETVLKNDKSYYMVHHLSPEKIDVATAKRGLEHLSWLHDHADGVTHAEDVLSDVVGFFESKLGANTDDFRNIFYGANSKYDTTSLINEMRKYDSLKGRTGIVQQLDGEMLDVVYLARAGAANLEKSVASYIEEFGGHYVGASVSEMIQGFMIGGIQTHLGSEDLGNEGNVVDFLKPYTFDAQFAQSESLSKHLQTHSADDTVLFIRRGQLDKTTGAEFAYIPLQDGSAPRVDSGYSITNEYWTFDSANTGAINIDGPNGPQQKFVVTLKNYADELGELGDNATRIILTGDSEEEILGRVSRLIDYGASEIFDKASLSEEEVIQQQHFKYVDEGRREYSKLFSVGDVRSEYDSNAKKDLWTGGYDDLKEKFKLHGKMKEWEANNSQITTVNELHAALRDIYADSKKDRFGDPKDAPITGRYQMQAFLEMRPQFENERELISDIIGAIDDSTGQGYTNLDRTILASRMYERANQTLLVGRTLQTGPDATVYHTDIHGLDVRDSSGTLHRIDAYDTSSMASRLSGLFQRSSRDDIYGMLGDLRDRELISAEAFSTLRDRIDSNSSLYNVATDLAYDLEKTRGGDKAWALQIVQDNLSSQQNKTYINAGGQAESFSVAYGISRQGLSGDFQSIISGYNRVNYQAIRGRNDDTKAVAGSILQSVNMGGGDLDSKSNMIVDMFSAIEEWKDNKPIFKPYAINGRENIQSFIVTPDGGRGSAYMFLTTKEKLGGLLDALSGDAYKDAFSSYRALKDSGILQHGAFIEIPHLNAYDVGDNGKKLYSVKQGPASEKFLMPEISVSYGKKDGKLRGYYNDPEFSLLGLYRKVGESVLDSVERNDFEGATNAYRKEFNKYLKDKPSSATYRYRDGKRMIHFSPSDAIHAYEIRMQDALDTIFESMVTPRSAEIHAGNLNVAQEIVNNFGHVLGKSAEDSYYNGNYRTYFKDVMQTNEFKEFFRRRMVYGSPSEEHWFEGVYGNEKYNKPILDVIRDFANSNEGAAIFDNSLIQVLNDLPSAKDLSPLGSESAVKRGSYFTRKHGSYVSWAGNYSTMRPMYGQQLNAMSFDLDEMRTDLQHTDFAAAQMGRKFSSISAGTQLVEEATYNMKKALNESVDDAFVGEHDFIARIKVTDIDTLQQSYDNLRRNSDDIISRFTQTQDKEIAKFISSFQAGQGKGISYQDIFASTIDYMQHEMGSMYQDKVFISPALQNTRLFQQRDPVKLQLNLDNTDIQETRKILYNLLGDKDSVELDADTIIGRRTNGTSIFYNRAKAILTKENIEELLSDEADGITRLATRFGDIMDNKMTFNGLEKATVHSIDTVALAKTLFGNNATAEQIQFASAFSSYLFNELTGGAMGVGAFRFGKHGGLVGVQSIWNTITKNYMEAGKGKELVNMLNAVAAQNKGQFEGLGKFSLTEDGRLIGNTALASHTSNFIEAVYDRVKQEANTPDAVFGSLSSRIVDEVQDLINSSSINMNVSRQNMNEHMGVRLAVDQRIDQSIRLRGLRNAHNLGDQEVIGLQELDMAYADNLRRQAESYNARGNGLSGHGLGSLQKAMDTLSVSKNYDRLQRNSAQQNMRRSLSGVFESIDYYDSQFGDANLRQGADYVRNRNIIEVGIDDLLLSTQKNSHILQSGSTLEEAENGLFYINGRPSKYLQQLADEKGFILDDSVHSLWIDMSAYKPSIPSLDKKSRAEIDGFMLPIQNITDMASQDEKLFFQNQQGKIAKFVYDVADSIHNNKGSVALGDLYGKLINELNQQTRLLDKDSDLYKAMQQYVLPNSHEFLALDEAAPLLTRTDIDNPAVQKASMLNQRRREILMQMAEEGGSRNKELIQEYTNVNKAFKEAVQELGDAVVKDDSTYHALMTLDQSPLIRDAVDLIVDGKRYHGLGVALGEEGIEKLGFSFGNVAMDVVADFEHRSSKKPTIERLEEFVESMGGDDAFQARIRKLHSALQQEFSHELDDLYDDYGFVWGRQTHANIEDVKVTDELNDFIYYMKRRHKDQKLDIDIRTLNENIAQRAEKVFKQSDIGQSYFERVGTFAEFMRFPAFRSQPLVRVVLDRSMNGQGFMGRVTNPILSLLSNLDFDGDKFFLGLIANGSSVLRTDSELYKSQAEIYKRFITTEAPGLLREAILSMDGYISDNPNDKIFQQAKILEIADGKAFNAGIQEYLKAMGLDPNLDLDDIENAGIFEAAIRSKEMKAAFDKAVPNTLFNTNMQVASLVARIRKNEIGYVSTPNYKIREALMQAEQLFASRGDAESRATR